MIELTGIVRTVHDAERQMRDWLNDHHKASAEVRHCCESVGALEQSTMRGKFRKTISPVTMLK